MKHSKYIATITASSVLFTLVSPSVFALDMWGYMNNNVSGLIQNATGSMNGGNNSSTQTTDSSSEDENIANTDTFSVTTYEIKKGSFSIGNTDTINIDGNLYVYGNLDVSNVDSFKVTGKLKVTGDLIVGNGDLENAGRIYVGGKKKFSNGSMKGVWIKVTTEFAKYDPILRADLDKEEETKVQEMIVNMKKKVEILKQEIKGATENKERIEPIKDKIRHEKEVFFNEMKPFIQEEDMVKFEKIAKDDSSATENFLLSFKRIGEPSAKLRQQIGAIIAKIATEQRESKLTMLVTKLETMITTTKLSDKKKLLISQVKEALQDELDNLTGDDTIDSIINGDSTTMSSTQATTATGSTQTTTTTSGVGSSQLNGSGSIQSAGTTTVSASGSATSTVTGTGTNMTN